MSGRYFSFIGSQCSHFAKGTSLAFSSFSFKERKISAPSSLETWIFVKNEACSESQELPVLNISKVSVGLMNNSQTTIDEEEPIKNCSCLSTHKVTTTHI